ncbi:outer membrane protein assembly factor BamD [Microscilla marina]|nr:tetratricopeptide repeat protein [Microscilla marina]
MKQFAMRFYLIWMCLCGWSFSNAQDSLTNHHTAKTVIHHYLKKANQLFAQKQYQQAQLTYERVVFLTKDKSIANEALLRKAYCHKRLKQFTLAQETVERAELLPAQDSVNYLLLYEVALNAYLAQQYKQSLKFINIIKNTIKDSIKVQRVMFLEILALNETYQWNKAKQLCVRYIKLHQSDQNIEALYGFVEKKPFKSIKKAKTISWIFPGAGQMYAGVFWRGVSSSVLTLGSLTFGVFSVLNGYYASGILTGLGMGRIFYTGGRRHAAYQTQKYNLKKIAKYHQKIKEFLLDNERKYKK